MSEHSKTAVSFITIHVEECRAYVRAAFEKFEAKFDKFIGF